MLDVLYLAIRYLLHYRLRTLVLVVVVTVIVYLPLAMNSLLSQSSAELRARAQATPLLVGAKGSPLELVLNSLYFETEVPEPIPYGQLLRFEKFGLATAIPLQTQFRSRYGPIVGTTLDYFQFRDLRLQEGHQMALLGDCVIGSEVASRFDLEPGSHLISSPESVWHLAGSYPLKLAVTGVLSPTGTPDDRAVFVDVKTAWVIGGWGHGHDDLTDPQAEGSVLRREGSRIMANASVRQYREITPETLATFHFHGDPTTFPLTAVLAVPPDTKSGILLQGKYLQEGDPVQVVRPADVMEQLLATILTVRQYVMMVSVILGVATTLTLTLVFLLGIQLRRREIETLAKIGASRLRIGAILATEVGCVLLLGMSLAALLAALTALVGPEVTRLLLRVV